MPPSDELEHLAQTKGVERQQHAVQQQLRIDGGEKPVLVRHGSLPLARRGEVLFHKGELSSAMFYTVTGRYRLTEIEQEIGPGQVIGETGLIAPDNKRTLTFECMDDGELLVLSYAQVRQLYFQNPAFGFYFLQLISQRAFKDIERLQQRVAHPA